MTAAADVIRATVHNRVDNQVRGASVANHCHRRSDRSRAALLRCRVSRRDQSLRPSHTVVTSQTVRRLTGRTGQLVTDAIPAVFRSIEGDGVFVSTIAGVFHADERGHARLRVGWESGADHRPARWADATHLSKTR